MEFEIHCDIDNAFGDYNPDKYPHPPHTDTLAECMDICSNAHPLCRAVSWNPDMEAGFANCYLKNSLVGNPKTPSNYVAHTAVAKLGLLNNSCPTNSTYTSNGKVLNVDCNQINDGSNNNLTSIHENDLDSCLDACASNTTCALAVFDALMDDGFDNCYLKGAIGVSSASPGSFFAVVSGKANTTQPSSSPAKHSKSDAWIAGPVIGGIIIVALIIGLIWLWRRKSIKRTVPNAPAVPPKPIYPGADLSKSAGYQPVAYNQTYEMGPDHNQELFKTNQDHSQNVHEMEGGWRHELEGSGPTR